MIDKTYATEKQPGEGEDRAFVDVPGVRLRSGGAFHTWVRYSIVCIHLFVFVYCWLMCFEPLSRYAVLNRNSLMLIYFLNMVSLFACSLLGDLRRGYSWARAILVVCILFEIMFSLALIKEFNALSFRWAIPGGLNYFFVYALILFGFLVCTVLRVLGGYSWCRVGYLVFACLGVTASFLVVFQSTPNVLSKFFPLFISYLLLVLVYVLSDSAESYFSVPEESASDLTVQKADRYWKYAVLGLLFFLLFYGEVRYLFDLWSNPQESHGLLIPAFSLYFLYQDRHRLGRIVGRANFMGLLLALNCMGWYVFWLLHSFGYPRQLVLILMLGSVVLFVGGWPVLRWVWLPIVFLLFAIPIPSRLHWEIAMPLRKLASAVASVILNGLPNIDCSHEGVLIHGTRMILAGGKSTLKEFSLNVAEACSGMRILRTFVALGVAMAYLEYRPWAHRLVLLLSTIPIAVFCNMLRVLITGILHVYFGHELSGGTPHMLLGMAMLIVAFGLYGVLAWIMSRIYIQEAEETKGILVVPRDS